MRRKRTESARDLSSDHRCLLKLSAIKSRCKFSEEGTFEIPLDPGHNLQYIAIIVYVTYNVAMSKSKLMHAFRNVGTR